MIKLPISYNIFFIYDATGAAIFKSMLDAADTNIPLEFVCNAVNAHDALVAALENLLAVKRGEGGTMPDAEGMAERALAAAKGGA